MVESDLVITKNGSCIVIGDCTEGRTIVYYLRFIYGQLVLDLFLGFVVFW